MLERRAGSRAEQESAGREATAVERYGKLDVLLEQRRHRRWRPIDEYSREDWDTILAVNLTGAFNGIQPAVPAMKNTGRGSIVDISSIEGLIAPRGPSGIGAAAV